MNFSLDPLFTDNMVLQQQVPFPVWGSASPCADVTVTFGTQSLTTKADATSGQWKVTLSPLTASSEPTTLTVHVTSADGAKAEVTLKNVLVGEVWVCSGQSNMEWPVTACSEADREIAEANHPAIRLLTVARATSPEPRAVLPDADWQVCSSESICRFSAVGYNFGLKLHRELGVPIGLINSSVGGTCAESWTSREGLLADPSVGAIWENYHCDLPNLAKRTVIWQEEMKAIEARTVDTHNAGLPLGFANLPEPAGDWKDMDIPANWRLRGIPFNGILWFRKIVEIPAAWAGKDLRLSIGATDKSDVTYFNGEQVGSVTIQDREDSWCFPRVYTVPGKLVKPGANIIAVRVHSDKYDGGMMGPAPLLTLGCPEVPEPAPLSLVGIWRYAVEANYGPVVFPPQPMGPDNVNSPTALYNGMIAPLIKFPIRGAIWYQGESNTGATRQYRTLFPALIRDWRNKWGNENLAFHFVQLANYTAVLAQPGESNWAELREAQTMALSLPHTGMAVIIDIGEANDIHPRNKRDVGLRLALGALHGEYGRKDLKYSSPLFREVCPDGSALRVSFDHAEGLNARGDTVTGFAIAGEDRVFVWASAQIENDTVLVSSPDVPAPKFVRYAWADNPICNLYNGAGLPASPFRTDIPVG